MEPTIIAAFSTWAINGVVSGVVANITYEGIKTLKGKFKSKMAQFFKDDSQAENFLKLLGEEKVVNTTKPFRDIEDAYESITNNDMPKEFMETFKGWILENKNVFEELQSAAGSMNIQSQSAGRDIINIQGNSTINNYRDKNE
ncbi:hypothetical protein ACPC0Q_27310 [Bacillus bombysepticus]|uniref:hypothetical protein n=1 Tax=Bacillus sp. 007/AIA-02/001 TaxID=2509009 RepID=UPI0010758851|nr:hypothetical protein [Bacillus sp. 007/AIA-02/001]TFW48655.1 hypothetical protein ES895_26925 [Bacillus sp. 007/AIA-02/001]